MTGTGEAESTLVLTRAAADTVRAANHAAFDAPTGDLANRYERAGAVAGLLSTVEQLVRALGEQVVSLPVDELTSTDGEPPAAHVEVAARNLATAASAVGLAAHRVNVAWSQLGPLVQQVSHEGRAES